MQGRQRGFSQKLLAAVTSQLFRCCVHGGNHPLHIRGDDAEGRVLEHRIGELYKVLEPFLRVFLLADITARNGQTVAQLDRLATHPACSQAPFWNGKLFVYRDSRLDDVAESRE